MPLKAIINNRSGKFQLPTGRSAILWLLLLLTAAGCGGGDSKSAEFQDTEDSYSLSGTVIPAEHIVSDSDVNDLYAAYESNDEFYQAQELSTPARVSGYVNQARQGPGGRSYLQGDPRDSFVVDLTAGMVISLYMAEDPASADLSLYLYDEEKNPVDVSLTQGEVVDSLSVPADGVYYIRVEATESASVYVLTVGAAGALAARYPLRLSDDFVPGEVVVRFDQQAAASAVSALSEEGGGVSSMGFYTKGASGTGRLLKRSGTADAAGFFEKLGIQADLSRSLSQGEFDSTDREKMETLWMIRALRNQPGVQYAEPNYLRRALYTMPNDPDYPKQWHYPQINLPDAWDITKGSADVVVAVVDTGVLSAHPDLDDQLAAGYDFVEDDVDPEDEDAYSHGTHVAGIVAAESDNSQGVAGVAWNARIMPLRVLDESGVGSNWDILQAAKYAAGLSNASGATPSEPADIINMSLGGEGASQYEAEIYEAVREQGVIIVAAGGSDGTDTKMYPAAYEGVVGVGAVTSEEGHAYYSNYGESIDVSAPGGGWTSSGEWEGIYSTIGESDAGSGVSYTYGELSGTSMAAPHVSGVAALMKSLYSGLTPLEFDALLQGGHLTRDLGASDWDEYFGYGLVDAYQAVQVAEAAGAAGQLPALLYASPGRLDFSALGSLLYVTVEHVGGGSISVTNVTDDASWLTVSAADVAADGLGRYAVTVARGGLSDGLYTGSITFETSGDPVVVRVRMAVGDVSGTLFGGYHYILLKDAETDEIIDQAGGGGEDGVYPFEFSDLSYGETFVIVAGTDPDNDGYICGDGEACGMYPLVDDPLEIEVLGSQSDLDFYSDIQTGLSATEAVHADRMGQPVGWED